MHVFRQIYFFMCAFHLSGTLFNYLNTDNVTQKKKYFGGSVLSHTTEMILSQKVKKDGTVKSSDCK